MARPEWTGKGWVVLWLGGGDALVGRLALDRPGAFAAAARAPAEADLDALEAAARRAWGEGRAPVGVLFPCYSFRQFLLQNAQGALPVILRSRLEQSADLSRGAGAPVRGTLDPMMFASDLDRGSRDRIGHEIEEADEALRRAQSGLIL